MDEHKPKYDLLKMADEMAAGRKRRKPSHEEDRLQISCRYWFDLQYPKYSLLLHHSPNEGLLPLVARDGAKRKAMGVRAGFPDLILEVPSRYYHALAIELKSRKGRQSDGQRRWQKAFEGVGGKYAVARSLEEFMAIVNEYMEDYKEARRWKADG